MPQIQTNVGSTGMPKGKGFNAYRESQKAMTDAERFWPRVDKSPHPKGCWGWKGSHNDDGYGKIGLLRAGKRLYKYVHRICYELHNGPIPAGMSVMHECDNPGCVNPQHLRLGTHYENCQDRKVKGRSRNQYTGKLNGGPAWATRKE